MASLAQDSASNNVHDLTYDLWQAVKINDIEEATRLLAAGADVNGEFLDSTILSSATSSGMARLLLSNGADMEKQITSNLTAIGITSSDEVTAFLINAGANIDILSDTNKTLLHYKTHPDIVNMLIQSGLNVNAQDDMGVTPLHVMVFTKNIGAARVLLRNGANTHIKEDNNYTALDMAKRLGYGEFIWEIESMRARFFLQALSEQNSAHMDLYLRQSNGELPLFLAIRHIPELLAIQYYKNTGGFKRERPKINTLLETTYYDLYELEDVTTTIKAYITSDKDNIVIKYILNDIAHYYFTTRTIINAQRSAALAYPCMRLDSMDPQNSVIEDIHLYRLDKIGLQLNPCLMEIFDDHPNIQLFVYVPIDITINALVSDILLNQGGNMVSALHCQEGYESKIGMLVVAEGREEDQESAQAKAQTEGESKENATPVRRSQRIDNASKQGDDEAAKKTRGGRKIRKKRKKHKKTKRCKRRRIKSRGHKNKNNKSNKNNKNNKNNKKNKSNKTKRRRRKNKGNQ